MDSFLLRVIIKTVYHKTDPMGTFFLPNKPFFDSKAAPETRGGFIHPVSNQLLIEMPISSRAFKTFFMTPSHSSTVMVRSGARRVRE